MPGNWHVRFGERGGETSTGNGVWRFTSTLFAASSKHVLGIFGRFDPPVVIERDRAFGDIEGEFAIGAFVVLPAAMGLLEKVVSETFDGISNGKSRAFDVGVAPTNLRDLDITVRNLPQIARRLSRRCPRSGRCRRSHRSGRGRW